MELQNCFRSHISSKERAVCSQHGPEQRQALISGEEICCLEFSPTLSSSDLPGRALPLLKPMHIGAVIWPTQEFAHGAALLNCPTLRELPTSGYQLQTAIANERTLQKRKKPYRKWRIPVCTQCGVAAGRMKVKFGYNTLTYTLMTEEGQPWDPPAAVCFVLWFCTSPVSRRLPALCTDSASWGRAVQPPRAPSFTHSLIVLKRRGTARMKNTLTVEWEKSYALLGKEMDCFYFLPWQNTRSSDCAEMESFSFPGETTFSPPKIPFFQNRFPCLRSNKIF